MLWHFLWTEECHTYLPLESNTITSASNLFETFKSLEWCIFLARSSLKREWYDESNTAQKLSVFGVFLVCIFPHLDWVRISPYSLQMRQNTDQKNSEFEHFPRSEIESSVTKFLFFIHLQTIAAAIPYSKEISWKNNAGSFTACTITYFVKWMRSQILRKSGPWTFS